MMKFRAALSYWSILSPKNLFFFLLLCQCQIAQILPLFQSRFLKQTTQHSPSFLYQLNHVVDGLQDGLCQE
jgi:hypothetical protein